MNELEVVSLLGKVRDSYSMVGNLATKQQKELMKYGKDRVVSVDPETSLSESSSEETYSEIKNALSYSIIKGAQIDPKFKERLIKDN